MLDKTTSNCVRCGKPADRICGHVLVPIDPDWNRRVFAGWCSDECIELSQCDSSGCYGRYDPIKHGAIIPYDFWNDDDVMYDMCYATKG